MINSKILLSGALILASAAVISGGAFAFFSDTESSQNNSLVGGALDLKIDNTSYYNGVLNQDTTWELNDLTDQLFFDFTDVKPSDLGEDTISLHAENDSWVCADFTLTENNDNTCTTNELENDPTCSESNGNLFDGELAQNIEFAFWTDDGDNVLETGEEVIKSGSATNVLDSQLTIADSVTNNIGGLDGDPMTGGDTHYIAKAWCFGDLTLDPLVQNGEGPESDQTPANSTGGVSCDGSLLNNATQSDRLLADIQFTAVQSRHNPDFVCEPVQISCDTADNIFAASVVTSAQGLRKNGTAVTSDRDDPLDATGVPQHPLALPSDSPVVFDSFFSLGFPHANNSNTPGSIELDMGEVFYPNPSGDDLFVYEVTGGVYPDETVSVYAKLNLGDSWSLLGSVLRDDGVELSAGGLTSARYVRIVEASNIAPFEATADGFDLDAVKAFCTEL